MGENIGKNLVDFKVLERKLKKEKPDNSVVWRSNVADGGVTMKDLDDPNLRERIALSIRSRIRE